MPARTIAATISSNALIVARTIVTLLFNRYTAFIVGVYLYSLVILALGGLGGMFGASKLQSMWLFQLDEVRGVYLKKEYWELTLLFYLYCYFNMILRPSPWQALLAALPLFLTYLGQDIYFLMYSSVFRAAQLAEVPELLDVLAWPYLVLLLVGVVLPLGFFLWSIDYRRRLVVLVAGALPPALLFGAAVTFPEQYIATYRKVGQEIVNWSDADTLENNGRFMMLLFREAERHLAKAKTEVFRDRARYEEDNRKLAAWIHANNKKRNVHLVVLESFLDPTLFKGATYTRDPFHPDFRKLFGNKMGFSISPVVGGRTAQAEFEILCGVPAFEEMGGVEFNSFVGSQAYCLPGKLGLVGYQTMASNAFNPSFFNTPSAYKGMGFGNVYFPREYVSGNQTYLSRGDTSGEMEFMFDGTLFAQNLDFITPFLKDNDGPPLFNYVLTVYGHYPHLMNRELRPPVLKMISSFKDEQLERAANQIFYRSQAVAEYVNRLIELDPKSLIILVSDHLPPGQHGRRSFQKLRYLNNAEGSLHMNRIMVVDQGKVKKPATMYHYDIQAYIFNAITDGAYCKVHACGFTQNKLLDDRMQRHEDYMRIMAHASK